MASFRIITILFCFLIAAFAHAATSIPPIAEVQRQALAVAGLDSDRAIGWESRARWYAAVPQLRVSFQRDLDEQLRLTNKENISISDGKVTIGPNEQDLVQDFDAGTRIQVTALWNLDRLVFNRDKILISQERRRIQEERQLLLDHVTKLYFDRQEALTTLASVKRLPAKDKRLLRRIAAERSAQLDALTGGWFGRQLTIQK